MGLCASQLAGMAAQTTIRVDQDERTFYRHGIHLLTGFEWFEVEKNSESRMLKGTGDKNS
jgi:hypothetical protein